MQQLLTTNCTGSRTTDRAHLIPAITTICIRCGTDADNINRLEITT